MCVHLKTKYNSKELGSRIPSLWFTTLTNVHLTGIKDKYNDCYVFTTAKFYTVNFFQLYT